MPGPRERVLVGGRTRLEGAPLIVAPTQYLLTGNELLRLRIWCLAFRTWPTTRRVFTLTARTVRTDGTYQIGEQAITPSSDGLVNTARLGLEPGALQSALVTFAPVGLSTLPGLAYAIVDFVQGTLPASERVIGTLVAGYLGPALPLAWPGTPIRGPFEGPGYVDTASSNGFVGAEWSLTVGANHVQRILAVSATLVTGPTAGSRRPRLQATINGATVGLLSSPQAIVASQTATTTWMPGAALVAGGANLDGVASLPVDLILRPSDALSTSTAARQVDDQYLPVVVAAEHYLEPLL